MNILVSGVLQRYTDYRREHSIAAPTIREGLDLLVKSYPRLTPILMDPDGQLRKSHVVFLNGSQVQDDHFEKPVGEQDRLEILTAIAGG